MFHYFLFFFFKSENNLFFLIFKQNYYLTEEKMHRLETENKELSLLLKGYCEEKLKKCSFFLGHLKKTSI